MTLNDQVMLLDKDTLDVGDESESHLHSAASGQKPPFTCDARCFDDFYDKLVSQPGSPEGEDQCKKVGR